MVVFESSQTDQLLPLLFLLRDGHFIEIVILFSVFGCIVGGDGVVFGGSEGAVLYDFLSKFEIYSNAPFGGGE